MTERGTSAVPVLAVSGRGEIEPGSGCGCLVQWRRTAAPSRCTTPVLNGLGCSNVQLHSYPTPSRVMLGFASDQAITVASGPLPPLSSASGTRCSFWSIC